MLLGLDQELRVEVASSGFEGGKVIWKEVLSLSSIPVTSGPAWTPQALPQLPPELLPNACALLSAQDEEDAASYFLLALAAAAELGDQELHAQLRAKLGAIPGAPGAPGGTPGCATDRPRWLSQGGRVV